MICNVAKCKSVQDGTYLRMMHRKFRKNNKTTKNGMANDYLCLSRNFIRAADDTKLFHSSMKNE